LEATDAHRLRLSGLHVGHVAVTNGEAVDLERVNRLQGVLPAVVGHRHVVFLLRLEVIAVDVERRAHELEVGDETGTDEG
jgi:hypothetical protein